MIKAIIFDFWETIATKNIRISKTLREKFGIEKTPDFLVKYELSIQLKKYETKEELSRSFLDHFNIEQSQENIDFVSATLQQGIDKATLFDGIYELLQSLSKQYKLGLISNTSCFESEAVERLKINNFFTAQVFSWEINSIKPNVKNFEAICEKLEVKPNEAVFIDDNKNNINSAKQIGLSTIQFRSVDQLKEDLKTHL